MVSSILCFPTRQLLWVGIFLFKSFLWARFFFFFSFFGGLGELFVVGCFVFVFLGFFVGGGGVVVFFFLAVV